MPEKPKKLPKKEIQEGIEKVRKIRRALGQPEEVHAPPGVDYVNQPPKKD
jgi:hypothetical protein